MLIFPYFCKYFYTMTRLYLYSLLSILFINSLLTTSYAQNTVQGSFVFGGINRTYRLYVPANYASSNAVPLLLNLHGYGSNNVEQEQYGDFRPIADTAGFLVLHPNGTPDNNGVNHWNTFGTSNVDDIGFLSALIDTISNHYNVDASRIYSTGMSNGGFMSYGLACSLSNKIAAVASVTGTMTTANFMTCMPSHPIPVMHIHGTADATVPYNGNAFFLSVPNIVSHWVDFNNTEANAVFTNILDINTNDGCTAELYQYFNGDNGVWVEHYKIIGGGHSWPGAPVNINTTNMDFSASQVIWQFLRKFNRSGLISTAETAAPPQLVVGPNPANGSVNVKLTEEGEHVLTLFDASGRQLWQTKANDNQLLIKLETNGFYLLKVSNGSATSYFKVLNQR